MAESSQYAKSDNAIVHDFYRALEPRYHAIITQTSPELHLEQFSGFSQDQLSGLAAYLFLPKDDRERIALFRQFATNSEVFQPTAAAAMKHYLQFGADIRMRYGLDWRNCLKNADRAGEIPVATVTLLDMLATYLQMPPGNEHERFNMLLHTGLEMKLISAEEFSRIHDDVFDYLKPPPRVDLELFKKTIEKMKSTTMKRAEPKKDSAKAPKSSKKSPAVPLSPPEPSVVQPLQPKYEEEAVPERKINFWYERLIELSEGGPIVKEDPKKEVSKPAAARKEEPKNEHKKQQDEPVKKAKEDTEKKQEKQSSKPPAKKEPSIPQEKPVTDEQKRRDLLGKLQSLGSF